MSEEWASLTAMVGAASLDRAAGGSSGWTPFGRTGPGTDRPVPSRVSSLLVQAVMEPQAAREAPLAAVSGLEAAIRSLRYTCARLSAVEGVLVALRNRP